MAEQKPPVDDEAAKKAHAELQRKLLAKRANQIDPKKT